MGNHKYHGEACELVRTFKYRLDNERWKKLRLNSYTEIQTSRLWNELEDYSGEFQVIYAWRRFLVNTRRGNAGRLILDAISYEVEGKSMTGQLDYGSSGSVKWYFEPSVECGLCACVWLIAYIALALYGCWYIPAWIVVLYFMRKRRLALKE